MGKKTSIILSEHFEKFISNEIKSGRYGSVSEVIRTALHLLENEERKVKMLREALVVGEKSEMNYDFDSQAQLRAIRNGNLH